ncbi:MAG: SirB2 family protein [Rubrivivax sp.]|nr:SirB2 family protein [Rubrivivax sp.]
MLSLHPLRDGWLGAKRLLIVAYIVIGSLALKRAPTRPTKALAFAAALACVAGVAAIALTHGTIDLRRVFSGPD